MRKKPQLLVSSAIACALILILNSCSLDGGAEKSTDKTGSAMSSDAKKYLEVSNNAGEEPTIGAPIGNAPTSLIIQDVINGDGAEVLSTSTLTVHYVLISWKSGQVLQSSWSAEPVIFPLSQVIPGWQQGIPGMKAGGRRLLVIPPELAYGPAGSGPIGANETLAFVVDLVAVS